MTPKQIDTHLLRLHGASNLLRDFFQFGERSAHPASYLREAQRLLEWVEETAATELLTPQAHRELVEIAEALRAEMRRQVVRPLVAGALAWCLKQSAQWHLETLRAKAIAASRRKATKGRKGV